jgi:hypothetical protein
MYRVKVSAEPEDAAVMATEPRRRSEDKTKQPW